MLLSLNGHLSGAVNAVRFSSDGNYCMTAGDDRMVMLWNPHREDPSKIGKDAFIIEYTLDIYIDSQTCTQFKRFQNTPVGSGLHIKSYSGVHGYSVFDVAIAKDNSKFASAGGDKSAFFWDISTGFDRILYSLLQSS